ncbi:MAG: DegT/DnrJ/EryC1/StrS family aminotransferase [Candidatus Zixiibacteriota bacterium]
MFYLISPSGTPVSMSDLIRTVFWRARPARGRELLCAQVQKLSRTKYCFPVNSGRCAQTLILQALKNKTPGIKDEIIVPAYTCYSVPASIVRAGLKVRPVDINPTTMDYDYDRLRRTDFTRVLALTAANLFGLVSNWTELEVLAAKHGFYLVDDAAQALGSLFDQRPAGSFGAAGFYSLDRGKNLSTYAGGILISDDDNLAKEITVLHERLEMPSAASEITVLIKMFLYALLLRPRLYWLPNALPFLGLGETVYDENFAMSKLSRLQTGAGAVMFPRLDRLNEIRRENACRLAEAISKDGRYIIPGYTTDSCPVYLRLPVLAENKSVRDKLIQKLIDNGIKASTMYPDLICRIPEIEPHLVTDDDLYPGATQVVEKLLTLPTHYYMRPRDIETVINCLVK